MSNTENETEIFNRIQAFIKVSNDIELIRNITLEVIDNEDIEPSYYSHEYEICKTLNLTHL